MPRIKLTPEEKKRRKYEYNRQYNRQYRLNNPEKVKERNRQYCLNNPNYQRQYYLKNKEKVKEYQRQCHLKNKNKKWIAPKEPLSKTKAELIALEQKIARLKTIPLEDKIYMKV